MTEEVPKNGARFRKHVPRSLVVSRLLGLYDAPRYLEIGVYTGLTFDQVEAAVKVGVDPVFQFDHEDAERAHAGVSYQQVTSDEYFGTVVGSDEKFDVIFLDGLHTADQTLRDLLNALEHLQPQGVILIDDVRPPTYISTLTSREGFVTVKEKTGSDERQWMGDVYQLMYFIDTFCQHLTFRTISNNHGQAVVWRKRRPLVTERSLAQVAQTTFEEFCLTEDVLQLQPLGRIIPELRADLGLERPSDSPG